MLMATADWHALATRPVLAITSIEAIALDGSRSMVLGDSYEVELEADGTGRVRLRERGEWSRVAGRFTAGLAADGDSLPDALPHGMIRLAAHQHHQRAPEGTGPLPPSAYA